MAPRLDQLPSELIDTIASFLSEEDLLTTRFVCHRLRSESESVFRRTFFTSRTTSLDMEDLNTLLEVSRHPRFSGDIKELKIDSRLLARPSSSPCPLDLCEPQIIRARHKGNLNDPDNQPLQEYRNALRKLSKAQEFAERTGIQAGVLTLILRNLSALTSIRVGGCYKSSFRKKVEMGWHSAGLPANKIYIIHEMLDDSFGADKVLTAMSLSTKPLISLYIHDFDPASSAVLEHLPTDLSYSLSSVRLLELRLIAQRVHTEQDKVARLLSYLTTMPKLEYLGLTSYGQWGPAIEHIGARILWPNLTSLHLWDFDFTAEGLHNFIQRHANTLREVRFVYCSLEPGDWRPILFSILNAGKVQELRVWRCLPSPDNEPASLYLDFSEDGTPVEVSAALSKFLNKPPQS